MTTEFRVVIALLAMVGLAVAIVWGFAKLEQRGMRDCCCHCVPHG